MTYWVQASFVLRKPGLRVSVDLRSSHAPYRIHVFKVAPHLCMRRSKRTTSCRWGDPALPPARVPFGSAWLLCVASEGKASENVADCDSVAS